MEVKEIFTLESTEGNKIPLFSMSVSAGIPIAVENDIEDEIDLNEYLIKHPAATYFARVKGNSMSDLGIRDDDILIFDTSLELQDGKIVIASSNNEMTVKVYRNIEGNIYLQSSNNQFLPLIIEDYLEFEVLGVVTNVIHSL